MSFERRILFAGIAFVVVLLLQVAYRTVLKDRGNDLYFPICAGQAILHGIDPYGGACAIKYPTRTYPPNPMTTVLAALPFAPFGYPGAIVMWSCLVGVMVFGVLAGGEYWRLLIVTSAPFGMRFAFCNGPH